MAEPAMDEMTAVRQLRADAPVPDLARLAPARRRLLDEIEGRPRHGRAGWKLKAAGAVAAVTAAALLSTLTLHEDDRTPTQPVPTATPRPTSWVFHQVRLDMVCDVGMSTFVYSEAGGLQLSPVGKRPCDTKTNTATRTSIDSSRWIRYDGLSTAAPIQNTGDPDDVSVWDDPSRPSSRTMLAPRETDALLASLPDDPDAALRSILRKSVPTRNTSAWRLTQAQRDFDEVVEVLSGASAVPPDKARTIHRIITGLEGATEPVRATDGAGREVLAIGVDGNFRDYAWERNSMQVMLDPHTFAYRGVRWVAGVSYYVGGKASGGPFVAKGTVLGTATRVATVVVDKAGDRN
ncbi:hypothetical protein [Streptomyces sp. NBC_01334]|uniref:hypothetical protein n=1 Tax=Streptomyces sp. NBC_01334 TaxID=2903827 RepID=UPI002E1473AD|nr:hypothetical protein OG736_26310 [Streptomyces sp. NBC_01334]